MPRSNGALGSTTMPSSRPVAEQGGLGRFYNARQAAALLGVTERTIRKWIVANALPAHRDGRQWRIAAEGLALMPRDRLSLVREGIRLRAAPDTEAEKQWLIACWRRIAEAAFVVHGGPLVGGCRCILCTELATLAAGYEPSTGETP